MKANKKRWNRDERKEILEYAQRLRETHTQYHATIGFAGYMTFRELARYEHIDDARTVAAWDTHRNPSTGLIPGNGDDVTTRIQVRMAAREEAFRLAGVAIGGN